MSLRILYAGTPEFAVPPLRALLTSSHQVVGVYTQPDRPAGRGRKLTASPVKQLALEAAIPVFQPPTFRTPESVAELAALHADLLIVAAYGLILPQAVLDAPRLGAINIHASLLPRWRGAAPIQRAILAGDRESGITIMQMEAGLDSGPMVRKMPSPIHPHDSAASLHDRLAALGAKALLAVLPEIAERGVSGEPQQQEQVTYASKLEKSEAAIDWRQTAEQIDRQVRAFNPWPVAQCRLGEKVLRIWQSQPLTTETNPGTNPGAVLCYGRDGIEVATGAGRLRILQLQPPGKRCMSAADFLNAHSLEGVTFE